MTTGKTISVTRRQDGRYDMQAGCYISVLDADELRRLGAEIDRAIGGAQQSCKLDDVCEHPHVNCGPGCDGYGN